MRIVPEAEEAERSRLTNQAAIIGAAAGLAFSLPTAFIMQRRWPAFRKATMSMKTFYVATGE